MKSKYYYRKYSKLSRMKKLNALLLFMLFFNGIVCAQQDPLFTQYTYNKLLVNPAYAGNKDGLYVTLTNRAQWIGIDGAPNTLTLSAHTLLKNKKVGLGLYIFRVAIGPNVNNGFMGTYAYRLRTQNGYFSFGLQGGLLYFDFDWAEMNLKDPDYLFDPSDVRRITPDVNIGLYYQTERFFAGLSSKHLLENDFGFVQKENNTSFERLVRHFYFMSGTLFPIKDNILFRPSTLVKFVRNAPVQFDINASVLFKDKFMVGASYRTEKAVTVMTDISLTERIRLGLSYDFYFNELQLHNYGSTEIRLVFDLKRKEKQLASVNFF